MTRAFTPPETLSKEEIRTIADVRRDIWTDAFYGMAVGSFSAIAMHTLAGFASRRGLVRNLSLNRNTALFSFLAGGAFGSFIMATTTGKNEVHKLHAIFEVGSKRDKESILRDPGSEERKRNRLLRRKTLEETLEHQHGLSDSHGGKWAPEDEFTSSTEEEYAEKVDPEEERRMRQMNRVIRRKTLQDTLEHQHGLSDSHGGKWASNGPRR
jgi:hypothetical protein